MPRGPIGGAEGHRLPGPVRQVLPGVVVALCLLSVVDTLWFDVFSIRTASMEPSLRGRLSGGDQVVVSRLHQDLFTIRRFEPVSFRYPNHRGVGYLKRVVGFEHEQIWLRGGDVWVGDEQFGGSFEEGVRSGRIVVAKKPFELQEALFHELVVKDEDYFRKLSEATLPEAFLIEGVEIAQLSIDRGRLGGTATAPWRLVWKHGVPDQPDSRRLEAAPRPAFAGPPTATEEVGDLSIRFTVRGPSSVELTIFDPATASTSRATWSPHADGSIVALSLNDRELGRDAVAYDPRDWVELRLDRVDHRITVFVAGKPVLARDDFLSPAAGGRPAARASWSVGGNAGPIAIKFQSLHRDLHYVGTERRWFSVPAGCGLALGDNTAGSADSRVWKRVVIQDVATGEMLTGDSAGVTAKELLLHATNPHEEVDGTHVFIDLEGREHRFQSAQDYRIVETWPSPYFRWDEVEGRCLAILFPWSRAGVFR